MTEETKKDGGEARVMVVKTAVAGSDRPLHVAYAGAWAAKYDLVVIKGRHLPLQHDKQLGQDQLCLSPVTMADLGVEQEDTVRSSFTTRYDIMFSAPASVRLRVRVRLPPDSSHRRSVTVNCHALLDRLRELGDQLVVVHEQEVGVYRSALDDAVVSVRFETGKDKPVMPNKVKCTFKLDADGDGCAMEGILRWPSAVLRVEYKLNVCFDDKSNYAHMNPGEPMLLATPWLKRVLIKGCETPVARDAGVTAGMIRLPRFLEPLMKDHDDTALVSRGRSFGDDAPSALVIEKRAEETKTVEELPAKMQQALEVHRLYHKLGKMAVEMLDQLDIAGCSVGDVQEGSLWLAGDTATILDAKSSQLLVAFCTARQEVVEQLQKVTKSKD